MFNTNPPGIIRPYAGASAPTGFLLCDGASYLRADYANLFAIIGTTFGAADGTHFNVPDIRGRVIAGYDSGDTAFDALGETGGAKTVNLQHSHTAVDHTHTASGTTSSYAAAGNFGTSSATATAVSPHTHPWSITTGVQSDKGSDNQLSTAQSILMPFITLNFIIKI